MTIKELYSQLQEVESPTKVSVGEYSDTQIRKHGHNLMVYTDLIRLVGEMVVEAENHYNQTLLNELESMTDDDLNERSLNRSQKEKYCKLKCTTELTQWQSLKNKLKYIEESKRDTEHIINIYKKLRLDK